MSFYPDRPILYIALHTHTQINTHNHETHNVDTIYSIYIIYMLFV